RWDNKRDAVEKDEAGKPPSPIWSHLAELQKTIFFENPEGDGSDATVMEEPPRAKPAGFPTGQGMDTIMVSREEFLEPTAARPDLMPPAPAPIHGEPAAEAAQDEVKPAEFSDLVDALEN